MPDRRPTFSLQPNPTRQTVGVKSFLISLALFSGSTLTTASAQSVSECNGANCACAPSELQFQSPTMQPGENGKYPISLEADEVEAQGEDLVSLKGNAEVSQGRQTIVADELQYYRSTDRVVATGNVEMISDGRMMLEELGAVSRTHRVTENAMRSKFAR